LKLVSRLAGAARWTVEAKGLSMARRLPQRRQASIFAHPGKLKACEHDTSDSKEEDSITVEVQTFIEDMLK
jgi:hypothetical protein